MRLKIKLVLPIFQMLLATVLLVSASTRSDYGMLGSYGPPERLVCWAINAPVAILYGLLSWAQDEMRMTGWFAFRYSILGPVIFVLAVGGLWYLVGVEIDAHRTTETGTLSSRRSFRWAVDTLLVTVGIILAITSISLWDPIGRIHNSPGYAMVVAIGYGAWALFLIAIYSRDLFLLATHKA